MNVTVQQLSGIYILQAQQLLQVSMASAWEFFCSPKNLQAITPGNLGFAITSGAEGEMYAGKMIAYELSVFPPLKTKWVTEITHVIPYQYFCDEQRFGPYAMWHHEHHFVEKDNGILMTDIVSYKLPLGALGRLFAGAFVKKKVMDIFNYRYKTLEEKYR